MHDPGIGSARVAGNPSRGPVSIRCRLPDVEIGDVRLRILVPACLVALALAPTAGALTTFYGTVGPGTRIVLKRADGTVVKNVRHGNKTFVIRDRSSFHNFHLFGPGVDRRTGVAFVGKRTWSPVALQIGRYTIVCDRHPLTMVKHFSVS
jgi:hypothetical protein